MARRQWVNRYVRSLGWPEADAINLCQKLMDDDRYGREKVFVTAGGNNHNRLTTNAAARLFQSWLDALDPREAFVARMVVKQVLQTLADDKARPAERFEARRELYKRLIAAGIVD